MEGIVTVATAGRIRMFDVVDDLPPDVVEDLDPTVVDELRGLDRIPTSIQDRIPDDVLDRIPAGLVDLASDDPTLAFVLGIIGVLALAGFAWGVAKSAIKAVVFFGVVAAVAWLWFFNV